jgi:chaperonin GroES
MPRAQTKKAKSVSTPWDQFITPLDDRVVVEIMGASEKTPGGLYIPASVQEKPHRGRVLAVGQGHRDRKGRLRPLDVKRGDEVLLGSHMGPAMKLNGTEVLILRESDLVGVIN